MRPFTVLIGIVLGSAASITFGLGAVLIVFGVLAGDEHPDIKREMPQLLGSLAAFAGLTTATAGSFLGQVKVRPWRGWAHLASAACLAAVVWLYWPRRN